MENIQIKLNQKGEGAFYFMEEGNRIGEMVMDIKDSIITVYHTEVKAEAEGKGVAKKLLLRMVNYARENSLKVKPLCPYVHLQFRRHPKEYADVWLKSNTIDK
jgi:predicted GNAT family acetyltransferase